jgi:hypothetical protein
LGEAQVLNAGMELARLNTACWVRERGDDSAVGLLDQKGFIAAVEQGLDRIDGFDFSSNQQDEQWSEMVQNTDDPGELMDLLRELDRRDRIQPKSSHALVLLAMQAPDLDVRDFAERVLVAHREDMNVLIALDSVAGLDRVSRRMNGVIGLVLGVDGNLDQHDLRRAIFRKLLELRILQDSGSARMYSIFANQYHRLLGIRVSGNGQATAQDLYVSESQQLMQAGNIVPMDVRAAIQIGLIRATNQAQNDAVYLDAALKVFAAHIADQNAGMLTQVSSILRDHRSRLEDSESVYEQIMLSERAFASLWLLLLESESFS